MKLLILYQRLEAVLSINQSLFISTNSIMKQGHKNRANGAIKEYLIAWIMLVSLLFAWLVS